MTIRAIDLEREYSRLSLWWTKRGLTAPSKVIFEGADGFCAQVSGIDLAVGWIMLSRKGTVAMSEFVTSNPAMMRNAVSAQAIEHLYSHFEAYAKEQGYTVLFTSTEAGGSISRFLAKRGWSDCKGEPHAHMVKAI